MGSPEYARLQAELVPSSLFMCAAESVRAAEHYGRTGSAEGLFFFDLEQLLAMDLDQTYGPADLGTLGQPWRGHPAGALAFSCYQGVTEQPPTITLGISEGFLET